MLNRLLSSRSSSNALSAPDTGSAMNNLPNESESGSQRQSLEDSDVPNNTATDDSGTAVSLEGSEDESDALADEYCHSLEIGDHVIRWTMMGFVYPIQIHGIVLSVGPDVVAIADFGYTSYKSVEGKTEVKDDVLSAETEEMNQQSKGKNRLNVVTLVGKKEIRSWKKVNYGEHDESKPSKLGKLTSWFRGGNKGGLDAETKAIEDQAVGCTSETTEEASALETKPQNLTLEYNAKIDEQSSALPEKEISLGKCEISEDMESGANSDLCKKQQQDDNSSTCKTPESNENEKGITKHPPTEAFIHPTFETSKDNVEICDDHHHDCNDFALKLSEKNQNEEALSKYPPTEVIDDSTLSASEGHINEGNTEIREKQQHDDGESTLKTSENNENEEALLKHPPSEMTHNTTIKTFDNNRDEEILSKNPPDNELISPQKYEYEDFKSILSANEPKIVQRQSSFKHWWPSKKVSNNTEEEGGKAPSPPPPRKHPKCDPTEIVVARVRFLLENESLLPPYHILYSNSECIAVWCKTGTWSTLQAAIFLHSTAVGNTKSTVSLALFASAQTVTVPATGWAGFWGGTTQVGLLTAQPWIIPAIAGYGICAVGMPYLILRSCKSKWENATIEMNDKFWGHAGPAVFVAAIHHWGNQS